MDRDEEDFVYFGAPIEREEDTSARKRKAIADAGQLRALPTWKQEVRDEEGRRRFHGAFTGGFSAGYYNTVGSKEGWTPQSFTSSRKNRADVKKQSVFSFLDEDEREEFGDNSLRTSSIFDTFGFTAAEIARKEAEKEQKKRPSVIPGPVPDEIVLPSSNSIGIKLLLKMGWRHGHSIKDAKNSLCDARREARKAFFALSASNEKVDSSKMNDPDDGEHAVVDAENIHASQDIPEFVLNPKKDLHGLGFDPFKHAPEFRDWKQTQATKVLGHRTASSKRHNLFSSKSGKVAPGFGIGALEELDFEDEDVYDSGIEVHDTYIEEIELPSRTSKDVKMLSYHKAKDQSSLTGFVPALIECSYRVERFHPPDIPHDFDPQHKFSAPLEAATMLVESPPPPVVSPPNDSNLRLLIEGFATLVTRCGKLFEDLSKEKNKDNPLFTFLTGGHGHEYYARMLWEKQQMHNGQKRPVIDMPSSSDQKKTAESRGRILGEKPLEKSSNTSVSSPITQTAVHFQLNLSDTFTKSGSHSNAEMTKHFEDDLAKQERFEQFLKDKFEGGLRSTYSGGVSSLSEADRARERLDFEATLEAMQKREPLVKYDQSSLIKLIEGPANKIVRFPSCVEIDDQSEIEEMKGKVYPKREEFEWRPAPILCKRFDIMDPFMGKPPSLPRARSRVESFIFMSDFAKATKIEEPPSVSKPSSSSEVIQIEQEIQNMETDKEPRVTTVQKPVDLYKAIFSDDSDDEELGNPDNNLKDDPEKKTEVANTALNRLVAGDFLESLGKELGLDVQMDTGYQLHRTPNVRGLETSHVLSDRGDGHGDEVGEPISQVVGAKYQSHMQHGAVDNGDSRLSKLGLSEKFGNQKSETRLGRHTSHLSHVERNGDAETDLTADISFQKSSEEPAYKAKSEHPSKRQRSNSRHLISGSSADSDSSVDHNHKKQRSRSRHRRSSKSDSDSSSDHNHGGSSSKSRRHLSAEKLRKHSKHHTEKSRKSSKNHHSHRDERDLSEEKRESGKLRRHYSDHKSSRSGSHRKHH